MSHSVRALIIEDNLDDAELMVLALEDSGQNVTHQRVDTEDAFLDALRESTWDVVLSDYTLPRYNGLNRGFPLAGSLCFV